MATRSSVGIFNSGTSPIIGVGIAELVHVGGNRRIGTSQLTFNAMLSLEPFTIEDSGSPQLFQTGESYQAAFHSSIFSIPTIL